MELTKTNGFNQKQFNSDFEKNDLIINKNNNINKNFKNNIEKIILPHQETVENIIINIRDLIFIIIDMLENQINPLPFILSSDILSASITSFIILSISISNSAVVNGTFVFNSEPPINVVINDPSILDTSN
jgi:hypothetical protein